jgi:hypothetical protein
MEYIEMSESNILDSVVQKINVEGSFANVDMGSATLEKVPDFIKLFPRELPIHDQSSWKSVGEIDLERMRYLLSADEMIEEMLNNKFIYER